MIMYIAGVVISAIMETPLILWLVILPLFIPQLAVAIRRIHDTDRSGWFYLVPFYNIVLLFLKGTPGENRFGAPAN